MGEVGIFQNFIELGDGNKLKWAEKIENSIIDPPTIREGRVVRHMKEREKCGKPCFLANYLFIQDPISGF